MITVARIVFFVFAVILICGGIAGYLQARSIISLAAGVFCGGLALYAALILSTRQSLGLVLGLAAALLAVGGMGPRMKNKKTGEFVVWPSGVVVAVSALTAVVAAAGLVAQRGGTR